MRRNRSQFKSYHVECVCKRLLTFIVVFSNNSAKCWGLQTLILYRKIISQFCFSGCLKKDTLWQKHNISPTNTHVDGTHCFWWINRRQARHTLLLCKMLNTLYTYWNMQWNPQQCLKWYIKHTLFSHKTSLGCPSPSPWVKLKGNKIVLGTIHSTTTP